MKISLLEYEIASFCSSNQHCSTFGAKCSKKKDMNIVVLDYSASRIIVYDKEESEVRSQVEQSVTGIDFSKMDETQIVEQWLRLVKNHRISEIHYMICESELIVEFSD